MSALGPKLNNFDFLRFVAAVMVVIGHSYALTGTNDGGLLSPALGEIGVGIFFNISGYLITASFCRRPKLLIFLRNRILRILPALFVVLIVTVFFIGPLFTSFPLNEYSTSAKTLLYIPRNLLLYPVTYILPGVFTHNPYSVAVNGSLWTLRLEFSFYIMVAVAGRLGLLNRWVVTILVITCVIGGVLSNALHSMPSQTPVLLFSTAMFAAGAASWLWADHGLRLDTASGRSFAATASVALGVILVFNREMLPPALALLLAAPVFAFALTPVTPISKWGRIGDLSYGVYVWAFPVQQMWISREGGTIGATRLTIATLLVILPISALSWWFVEKPALNLKLEP